MVDVLLRAGASINQKSHWWAGRFQVLDEAASPPRMPAFLIGRGAWWIPSMARVLLEHGAPVHVKGDDYDATPLGWALHGLVHGWRAKTGDYAGTVAALLEAGAEAPPVTEGVQGAPAVIDVLRRHHLR